MAIRLVPAESNKVWEDYLVTYCPSALFQSWLWGEVQKKAGEKVYRFIFLDGKDIAGLAQIFVVRAKRGTFLHVRHGPVWATKNEFYWRQFFELLGPFVKREKAWFVRVSPLVGNTEENREFFTGLGLRPAPIHEVDAERCWVLDMDKSEDEILMGMRKTTRYEIRLAEKSGVIVRTSTKISDLRHFYELYQETSRRHGFVTHGSISEEFELFAAEGKALLFLGFHEGRVVASTIVLFYGNEAIYHHGASIPSRVPVSHLLQWKAILEAKKRGMKLYNFYGIAPEDKPNHPWRGITLFKKGFGGREINYIHAHDLATSPLYLIPKTIETVRRKLRGY